MGKTILVGQGPPQYLDRILECLENQIWPSIYEDQGTLVKLKQTSSISVYQVKFETLQLKSWHIRNHEAYENDLKHCFQPLPHNSSKFDLLSSVQKNPSQIQTPKSTGSEFWSGD